MVLLHVSVALLSLVCASLCLVAPSRRKLRVSYGLVAATLASGTYLVWSLHSPLLQSCVTGLMYLAAVAVLNTLAYRRLARQTTNS